MKRKIVIWTIAVLVLALAVYRIFEAVEKRRISKQTARKESSFVYAVKIKKVGYGNIADSVNFVGEIKGINEVTVTPKVAGRLIKKVKEEGSYVKKDEVICEIDRDEPVLKYSVYELKSPIDGILGKYLVDVGGMVSPQTPVCIISDTQKVKLIFNIPENVVNKINKNSYVKFATEDGRTYKSFALQLSNYIDPVSRSMEVRVVFDNPSGVIKSGSFVKGELIFYEKQALVIPTEALLKVDSKDIVFVVKDDNTVEEREIKVGLRYKNLVEVYGVKNGEKVVYQGGEILTDGMKVEVVEE